MQLGIVHTQLTQRDVAVLSRLDAALPAECSLVVTPTPAMALEFQRTRTLATSAVSDSSEFLAANPRSGLVGNLVIITEAPGMSESKVFEWLNSFRSYRSQDWSFVDVDSIRIYVPDCQMVDRLWLIHLVGETK
jgi:hypothetical protein